MEKGRGKGTDTLQTNKVFTRKKYIERNAAISVIAKISNESDMPVDWHKGMSVAMSAVCRIPAADVVPVVRCRDCKHRDPEDKKCDCGGLEHAHMFPVADDWFCADGEKREVEHD